MNPKDEGRGGVDITTHEISESWRYYGGSLILYIYSLEFMYSCLKHYVSLIEHPSIDDDLHERNSNHGIEFIDHALCTL